MSWVPFILILCFGFILGQRTYQNPVLPLNFPDPCVIRAPSRVFYAYGTAGCQKSACSNIQMASSTNLVDWKYLGDALPEKASWASATDNYWAPDVILRDGVYYLYFAAQQTSPQEMCIGVALSSRPEGPFKDSGKPVVCGSEFQAIDPKAYDDPLTGKKYLFWGSDFAPIRVQELAENRMEIKQGTSPVAMLYPDNDLPYEQLIEGAWIQLISGTYYLFFSGNNCCGPSAHYAVMIAKSQSLLGPYLTRRNVTGSPDNVIMQLNQKWIAPGHNSVVVDDAGQHWMMYHAISAASHDNGTRYLMMDPFSMRSERGTYWPKFSENSPSVAEIPVPFIK